MINDLVGYFVISPFLKRKTKAFFLMKFLDADYELYIIFSLGRYLQAPPSDFSRFYISSKPHIAGA